MSVNTPWRKKYPEKHAAQRRRYREKYPTKDKERAKRARDRALAAGPLEYIRVKWATRASTKRSTGAEFTIKFDDLEWPTHCPALGIPIDYGNKADSTTGWSLDRLDSSLGYVPGNVRVISRRANTLKNNGTFAELRQIADWLERELQQQALETAIDPPSSPSEPRTHLDNPGGADAVTRPVAPLTDDAPVS